MKADTLQLVLSLLEDEPGLDTKTLAQRTGLARRTIRTALRNLRSMGLVQERCRIPDTRVHLYFPAVV